MKKINYFIIVAAILMLIVPLLGCPTAYKDADIALKIVTNIIGDAWGDSTPLVFGFGETETTIELTYSNDMKAWGGGDGTLNFAIRENDGWDVKYTGATGIKVGAGYATTKLNDGLNNTFIELEDGKTYVITVLRDPVDVKVKIDLK